MVKLVGNGSRRRARMEALVGASTHFFFSTSSTAHIVSNNCSGILSNITFLFSILCFLAETQLPTIIHECGVSLASKLDIHYISAINAGNTFFTFNV